MTLASNLNAIHYLRVTDRQTDGRTSRKPITNSVGLRRVVQFCCLFGDISANRPEISMKILVYKKLHPRGHLLASFVSINTRVFDN